MSPVDVRVLAARAEIERDWAGVLRQLERARSVDPAAGDPEASLVALALDHAYEGFEQILLRLERALSLPERTGASWHRSLLCDAATPIAGVRPALFPAQAEQDWEQLLGFRHFLRHAYAAELDPERLRRNVDHLSRAVERTDPMLQALLATLAAPSDDDE